MTVRPLDLLDLPTLARYRRRAVALDSARLLTRGDPLGPIGLLAYLNPGRHIYTALAAGEMPLLGGVIHDLDQTFARLTFLAPADRLDGAVLALLDHLAVQAGGWGGTHLLAEGDEASPVFPLLRQAGFAVYAWQVLWALEPVETPAAPVWRPAGADDLPAARALHQQIVPGLLQPVEPAPRSVNGLVCDCPDGLQAHVRLTYGARGVLADPLFHPDAKDVAGPLAALAAAVPRRGGRQVHLRMRSYQAWLEPVLADLGAQASPRQAVMVKPLAATQRLERATVPQRERALAKPAAPIAPPVRMDKTS